MFEWHRLTSAEIPAIDRRLPVIIPVGLIEAHGPHLPVSVDNDMAQWFAREVAQATGVVLAPPLNYGFADEMREYPGTVGLRPSTLTAVAIDIMEMFIYHGFKRLIWMSGHGANKAPVELAFYPVWEKHPDLKVAYWNYWSEAGFNHIHHADKRETEIYAACGNTVYMDRVQDFKVPKPWHKIRSRFALQPDSGGINGEPSLASTQEGSVTRDAIVRILSDQVRLAMQD